MAEFAEEDREARLMALDKELGDNCAKRGAHTAAVLHYDAVLRHPNLGVDVELAVLANRCRSRGHTLDWAGAAADGEAAALAPRLRGARRARPSVALKAALRSAEAWLSLGDQARARRAIHAARYFLRRASAGAVGPSALASLAAEARKWETAAKTRRAAGDGADVVAAVAAADAARVGALLAAGAPPDAADADGLTGVAHASRSGDRGACLGALLAGGACPDARDPTNGAPALLNCAARGDVAGATALLDAGAAVDARDDAGPPAAPPSSPPPRRDPPRRRLRGARRRVRRRGSRRAPRSAPGAPSSARRGRGRRQRRGLDAPRPRGRAAAVGRRRRRRRRPRRCPARAPRRRRRRDAPCKRRL